MIIQREKHTYYLPTDVITLFDNSYEDIEFYLIEDDILVPPYYTLVSFKNINVPELYDISYDIYDHTGTPLTWESISWPDRKWYAGIRVRTEMYGENRIDGEGSFDIYYDGEFVTTIRVITYATPPVISVHRDHPDEYTDAAGTFTYKYTSDKPVFWGSPRIIGINTPYMDSDYNILGYYNTGIFITSNLNYNTYCYGTEFMLAGVYSANQYKIYRSCEILLDNINTPAIATPQISQSAKIDGATPELLPPIIYEFEVEDYELGFYKNENLTQSSNAYVVGYEGEVTDGDGWKITVPPNAFYDITLTNPTNYNTDYIVTCYEDTDTNRYCPSLLTFNGYPVGVLRVYQYSYGGGSSSGDTGTTYEYYVSNDNITFDANENLTNSINAYVIGYEGEVTNGNGWNIVLPPNVFYDIALTNPTNYNTNINITCYENTNTTSRTSRLQLTFNGNPVKTITINQDASSGGTPPDEPSIPPIDGEYTTNNDLIIDIYPTIQYVGYNGGYARFNITTNYLVNWEMGYSADWLVNSLRVSGKQSIFEFNILPNASSERSARITFTTSFSGATYTKEVVIWQEAAETVPEFNDNYWSVPPMFMDGVDTISYTNSEGTSTDMENNPITINRGINNHSLYNTVYYDSDVRLCFKKGDDKVVDGEDVLIFYDKPKYFKDDFNERYAVYLTDDNPEMMILNDGKPCWLYNQSNINDVYSTILQYPHFDRYLTYKNNVTDSYNIGNPIKTFTLDYKFSEGTDIYSRRWDDFLSEQYNINTRILECYVKLPYNVMQEYLRNFFYFDDSYWCLIEVIDYSLTSEQTTKCKFIKVTDIGNYI